jgi:tripartite-type tricarboxylate transporter receptor subunit TctC
MIYADRMVLTIRENPMLRVACTMISAVGLLLIAEVAGAQQYPTRPIRFVQGFAPGGNADVITRVLGAEMSKGLGRPVISEARIGAGGNIAAEQVARGEPDGYTLQEFRRVIALPNVDEQLRGLGGFPKSSTPEEATNRVKFEIPLWKELAEKAGIPKR